MKDKTIPADLRQVAMGQIKAREFTRYDIGGYRFRTAKLEASRPLAATVNSGVATSSVDGNGNIKDYYGVLQKIIEYTWGGEKELKLVFFDCEWFDPVDGTRMDEFGMVEVKHTSRISGRDNNIVLAHQAQQVYYLSYPHPSMKNWWVVYKVNPEVNPRRYDSYIESNEDEDEFDIYQEEIGEQDITISDGEGLSELSRGNIELMPDDPGPSRRRRRQPQRLIEEDEEQRRERLHSRVVQADSDADDF